MAKGKGSAAGKSRSGKLTYFYLNGNLHRSLFINRTTDTIVTWCYPLEKRISYVYSDTKKHREFAFTTKEVATMLNRTSVTLERNVRRGNFLTPQHTYGIDENKKMYKYMWAEKHILDAHDYFSTVHRGRPRADGLVTPQSMPTKKELRAMIRQESVLYVRLGEEFVPAWRAQNFD